jgi:hypothetical protein
VPSGHFETAHQWCAGLDSEIRFCSVSLCPKAAFGDLPPVRFKYCEQIKYHVMTDKISFEQAEEAEEGDDCSWISVYRLYGCEPLFV